MINSISHAELISRTASPKSDHSTPSVDTVAIPEAREAISAAASAASDAGMAFRPFSDPSRIIKIISKNLSLTLEPGSPLSAIPFSSLATTSTPMAYLSDGVTLMLDTVANIHAYVEANLIGRSIESIDLADYPEALAGELKVALEATNLPVIDSIFKKMELASSYLSDKGRGVPFYAYQAAIFEGNSLMIQLLDQYTVPMSSIGLVHMQRLVLVAATSNQLDSLNLLLERYSAMSPDSVDGFKSYLIKALLPHGKAEIATSIFKTLKPELKAELVAWESVSSKGSSNVLSAIS